MTSPLVASSNPIRAQNCGNPVIDLRLLARIKLSPCPLRKLFYSRLVSRGNQTRRAETKNGRQSVQRAVASTEEQSRETERELSLGSLTTDWTKLRIEPLLKHLNSLEQLLHSEEFSRESSHLTKGVRLFHSDLVYLRENVKELKRVLLSEKRSFRK